MPKAKQLFYALLAQLAEQQPFKLQVVGSNPAKRTTMSA